MEQILITKLFIPPVRPALVPRPRLVERLSAGLQQNGGFSRKLTLISAPAGFGKTTLVSEWVRDLYVSQSPAAAAWVSLDEQDNDPARFLMYVYAALGRAVETGESFGQAAAAMLQAPNPPPAEAILTELINELVSQPTPILLVLDDYHLIEAAEIDTALAYLVDHLPPAIHLVIVTRVDPLLPLAKLRARGQLQELRAADLRFTTAEAAEFLQQSVGLELSPSDIAILEERTEGWIAGLQLAAISLQGHKDTASQIKSFSGSHRYVMDYLVEEVLEQQPKQVQAFLLQTAILNRLTGSLCDALTGQGEGQATLEMLSSTNLFILPLDEERRWYRYHQLFADLLRQRLRQTHPEQLAGLHIKASLWYEAHSLPDEAIDFALRAGDFDRAASLTAEIAEEVWVTGIGTKLQRWLRALPDDILRTNPQLAIYHAWYLLANGSLEDSERFLQAAEQALSFPAGSTSQGASKLRFTHTKTNNQDLHGRLATARAFLAFYRGDIPGIVQHAQSALEKLSAQDLTWRSTAIHILGDAYDFQGKMAAAYQSRLDAVEASQAAGNTMQIMIANLKLAIVLRHQGRLQQVVEICRQQKRIAEASGMQQSVLVGWLLAIWGEALAEMNEVQKASRLTKQGVKLTEGGKDLAILGWSYLCRIRVLFSCGELEQAETAVARIDHIARTAFMPPWILSLNAAWQARIWLALNKLEAAVQWLEARRLSTDTKLAYPLEAEHLMLARIQIRRGQLDQIQSLLQRLLESARAGDRTTRVIEILILQALAFQAAGDQAPALKALQQALNLAEPRGFMRVFIDEGPPMAKLLYTAAGQEIAPAITHRLLAAFPFEEEQKSAPSRPTGGKASLLEPLSTRELEVLELIATGISNQEVASRLFLSLNTIKVHTRNIYSKLGVNNRTQAVARARGLGILPNR